jgi:hypothetical protein
MSEEERKKEEREKGELNERRRSDRDIEEKPSVATEARNAGDEDDGITEAADVAAEKSDLRSEERVEKKDAHGEGRGEPGGTEVKL